MTGTGRAPLLAFLLLAGCLGSDDRSAQDADGATGLRFLAGDDPAQRTTAAAPQWSTGEWWRYRVTPDAHNPPFEVTRVVAGRDGDTYVVGMPLEDWSADVVSFHLPAFGDIRASDLAYEVHDGMYKLLDFPLTPGATWQAFFEFDNVTVTVHEVTTKSATLAVTRDFTNPATSNALNEVLFGGNFSATVLYDAELGEVRSLDIDAFGLVEVVDHGFGWTGTLRCPRGQDFVFFEGGIGPVAQGTPAGTPGDAEVGDQYDGMALTMGVGPLGVGGVPLTGYYRERATAPDGTVYEVTALPAEGEFQFHTFGVERPGGRWTFEHVAGGPGLAQSEGFAFEVHDVTLPGLAVTRPPWRTP